LVAVVMTAVIMMVVEEAVIMMAEVVADSERKVSKVETVTIPRNNF
jgi:hypothetical protein